MYRFIKTLKNAVQLFVLLVSSGSLDNLTHKICEIVCMATMAIVEFDVELDNQIVDFDNHIAEFDIVIVEFDRACCRIRHT